jgi:hypothetical protein
MLDSRKAAPTANFQEDTMRKGIWGIGLAIVGLALPFTLLALAGAAWLTENLTRIAAAVGGLDVGALVREGWSRWPEVLGVLIGQALMLLVLILARRDLATRPGEAKADR